MRKCDDFKMDHDSGSMRPQRSGPGALFKYLSGVTKDEFGWTLEEKYKQIQPEKRYGPLIHDIMRSKEAR